MISASFFSLEMSDQNFNDEALGEEEKSEMGREEEVQIVPSNDH